MKAWNGRMLLAALVSLISMQVLVGCSREPTPTEVGLGAGAVIGSGVGASIGNRSGNTGEGAAIGAAAGSLMGATIGAAQLDRDEEADMHEETLRRQQKELDRQRRELKEIQRQRYYDERLRKYGTDSQVQE